MTPQDQIKAIAELAGITIDRIEGTKGYECVPQRGSPDDEYELVFDLNSRDAIMLVIEKENKADPRFKERWREACHLVLLRDHGIDSDDLSVSWQMIYYILMTPPQLCEALLRATGRWTE